MLDVAWPEVFVIGVVALVAVGPKDLPKVMYKLGRWASKLRQFAAELQRSFNQLDYEAMMSDHEKDAPFAPPSNVKKAQPDIKRDDRT